MGCQTCSAAKKSPDFHLAPILPDLPSVRRFTAPTRTALSLQNCRAFDLARCGFTPDSAKRASDT